MTKMKPHVKAAWLEALRSGRYKQGRGHLRGGPPGDSDFCSLTHTAAVTVANMNDGELNVPPRSLSEIADRIERNL